MLLPKHMVMSYHKFISADLNKVVFIIFYMPYNTPPSNVNKIIIVSWMVNIYFSPCMSICLSLVWPPDLSDMFRLLCLLNSRYYSLFIGLNKLFEILVCDYETSVYYKLYYSGSFVNGVMGSKVVSPCSQSFMCKFAALVKIWKVCLLNFD